MFFCPNGTYMPAENCTNWDFEGQSAGCKQQWGVTPRKEWAKVILGGKRIQDATNVRGSRAQTRTDTHASTHARAHRRT